MPWGYHLTLDCRACKIGYRDPETISRFAKDLVKRIDMVPYGEPQVVHFADHDTDKAGWTLVQLIETSNIIAHFCDNSQDGYIDVFSCKDFDQEEAQKCVAEYFEPESIKVNFMYRQA